MESSNVISLEVLSNDREVVTEDKAIQANLISKQIETMSIHQCNTNAILQKTASSNTNQLSDKNEIHMSGDDMEYQIPNITVHRIDKADLVPTYENSTHITAEMSESGLSEPTQTINPQTVKARASYVCIDNYNRLFSDYEFSEVGISSKTEAISIKTNNTGITKQIETRLTKPSIESQQFSDNANKMHESDIYMNDFVNLPSIYEDIMDNAESDVVSTHDSETQINIYEDIIHKAETDAVSTPDNKTQISTTDQLDKTHSFKSTNTKKKFIKVQPATMKNKCKLALALLVGLVITVLVVSLIVLGVKSRETENIKVEPVNNLTTVGFGECWDKSLNYSDKCNNFLVTLVTDIKPNVITSNNISLITMNRTDIGECMSNPCIHGTCNDEVIGFMCNCHDGYTGSLCEIDIYECSSTPCLNRGTCSDEVNGYSCGCVAGYCGVHCGLVCVGFTAWATSVVRYSAGTTLIFNGVDEEHNGFDRKTGIFICPISGIYYVYVTLRQCIKYNINVDVFKMDTRIIRFVHKYNGSPWNTFSNSALVSCSRGEIIQMQGWSSGRIYGEANVRCSSFSVINMHQTAKNSPRQNFIAYSGYANYQPLNADVPINFTNPLCNLGNQFTSSRFTCPYTGIYFVSVTYWKKINVLKAYLYRVDTKVLYSYIHTVHSNSYATNNALVRCNAGEYIENRADGNSSVYGSGSYPESIFTVMSVHQDDHSQPFIGFSCAASYQKYTAGDIIRFTQIIMNDGNYLWKNEFVCPMEGFYYFLVNMWKNSRYKKDQIKVDLKHSGKTVFRLEDTQNSSYWNTISNSAVIRCMKGESVKVVAVEAGTVYHTFGQTTFSGFLLRNNY